MGECDLSSAGCYVQMFLCHINTLTVLPSQTSKMPWDIRGLRRDDLGVTPKQATWQDDGIIMIEILAMNDLPLPFCVCKCYTAAYNTRYQSCLSIAVHVPWRSTARFARRVLRGCTGVRASLDIGWFSSESYSYKT